MPSHIRAEYAGLALSEDPDHDASRTPKLSGVTKKRQSACSGISIRVHKKTPEPVIPIGDGKESKRKSKERDEKQTL